VSAEFVVRHVLMQAQLFAARLVEHVEIRVQNVILFVVRPTKLTIAAVLTMIMVRTQSRNGYVTIVHQHRVRALVAPVSSVQRIMIVMMLLRLPVWEMCGIIVHVLRIYVRRPHKPVLSLARPVLARPALLLIVIRGNVILQNGRGQALIVVHHAVPMLILPLMRRRIRFVFLKAPGRNV
jgi:hypothetical protein